MNSRWLNLPSGIPGYGVAGIVKRLSQPWKVSMLHNEAGNACLKCCLLSELDSIAIVG